MTAFEREVEDARRLLEQIATGLVGEHVPATATMAEDLVVFELHPVEGTAGRLIGKQGRTIQAIRTVYNSLGGRHALRFDVTTTAARANPHRR